MSEKTLTEEIKTRVPREIKKAFADMAKGTDLKPAHFQREAFREFVAKKKSKKNAPTKLVQESTERKAA